MSVNIVTKSAVSVTEMARMVGLSRARFYQLVRKGTFPSADQDSVTSRPCYLELKQQQILEARRRNCGVDGKPILFYCRRNDVGVKRAATPKAEKPKPSKKYTEVIDGLEALGISTTIALVESVMNEVFPNGTEGIDPGEIIKAVFLQIRRQNPSGSA